MPDTNYDGIIQTASEWVDIPSLSAVATAIGGSAGSGVMNQQAVAISKKLNYLYNTSIKYDVDGNVLIGTGNTRSGLTYTNTNPIFTILDMNTPVAGDLIGGVFFGANDQTSTTGQSGIASYAPLSWTIDSSTPTYLSMFVTPTGSTTAVEAVRITGQKELLVGTTTGGYKLHVAGSAPAIRLTDTTETVGSTQTIEIGTTNYTRAKVVVTNVGSQGADVSIQSASATSGLTEKIKFTSTGLIAAGAPSNIATWNGSAKVLQLGEVGSFYSYQTTETTIGNNIYFDSTGIYKQLKSGTASIYRQTNGKHIWGSSITTGSQDGSVTLTNILTLDPAASVLEFNNSSTGVTAHRVYNNESTTTTNAQASYNLQTYYGNVAMTVNNSSVFSITATSRNKTFSNTSKIALTAENEISLTTTKNVSIDIADQTFVRMNSNGVFINNTLNLESGSESGNITFGYGSGITKSITYSKTTSLGTTYSFLNFKNSSGTTVMQIDETGPTRTTDAATANEIPRLSQLMTPPVVDRGSTQTALLLDRFDQIHRYSVSGQQYIDIGTQMVVNGIYEVYGYAYAGNLTSNKNSDIRLYPNFSSYSGQFVTNVITTGGASDTSETSFFLFDTYQGTTGSDPAFKLTIFNLSGYKKVIGNSGDTVSAAALSGQWKIADAAGTSSWVTVGRLSPFTTNGTPTAIQIVVYVKRVA